MSAEPPEDDDGLGDLAPTGGQRRGVLLVPLAGAQQAAELAAYLELTAIAVPARRGVLVVPRDDRVDENLAVRASRLLRRTEVLVLRLADERVEVERWRAGRLVDRPPYGALGDLGDDAERVLLGAVPAGEATGAVATEDVDGRAFSQAAVTAARGPVKTWQLALQGFLAVLASFLAVVYVSDALLGGVETGFGWFRVLLWPLLALFWLAALRAMLRRRAVERSTAARDAGATGQGGGLGEAADVGELGEFGNGDGAHPDDDTRGTSP